MRKKRVDCAVARRHRNVPLFRFVGHLSTFWLFSSHAGENGKGKYTQRTKRMSSFDSRQQAHMINGTIARMPRPLESNQVTGAHLKVMSRIGKRFARHCNSLARVDLCMSLLRILLILWIGTSHDYALMPLMLILALALLLAFVRIGKLWSAATHARSGASVIEAHTTLAFRKSMPAMRQFAFLSEFVDMPIYQAYATVGMLAPPVLTVIFALVYFCFSFLEAKFVVLAVALEMSCSSILYTRLKSFYRCAVVDSVDSVLDRTTKRVVFAVSRSTHMVNNELHKAVSTVTTQSSTEALSAEEAVEALEDEHGAQSSFFGGFSGTAQSGSAGKLYLRSDFREAEEKRKKREQALRAQAAEEERQKRETLRRHARLAKQI